MNNNFRLTDLPLNERPRERLLRYGAETLSNSELIAIILGNGTSKENILSISTRLLKITGGLNGLLNSRADELVEVRGIGKVKAVQLLALGELSKRFKSYKSGENYKILNSRDRKSVV